MMSPNGMPMSYRAAIDDALDMISGSMLLACEDDEAFVEGTREQAALKAWRESSKIAEKTRDEMLAKVEKGELRIEAADQIILHTSIARLNVAIDLSQQMGLGSMNEIVRRNILRTTRSHLSVNQRLVDEYLSRF